MELRLKRTFFGNSFTSGVLYVDGVRFCDTLEDKYRNLSVEQKVAGETAIPFGTYAVVCRESPKFKRVLPRLLDVPHFDGILIHRGNTAKDTAGCILVGDLADDVNGRVVNSTYYEVRLTDKILSAIKNGGNVTIKIE